MHSKLPMHQLLKILVIVLIAPLLYSKNANSTTELTYSVENGLSKAWYRFVEKRRNFEAFSGIYEVSRLRPTKRDYYLTIDACFTQSDFNDCDLLWCIASSKRNYSQSWVNLAEQNAGKKCPDQEILSNFYEKINFIKKGRVGCLKEYQSTGRLGYLHYNCEGLLD